MKMFTRYITDSLKLWVFLAGGGLVCFLAGTVMAENPIPMNITQADITHVSALQVTEIVPAEMVPAASVSPVSAPSTSVTSVAVTSAAVPSETVSTGGVTPEMMARFERLEAETQRLRQEVARLRTEKSVGKPQSVSVPTMDSGMTAPIPAPATMSGQVGTYASVLASEMVQSSGQESVQPSVQETMTREEVDAYIQKHIADSAWRVGPVKITPYGRIWASMLVSSSRTMPQDAVMYALPSDAYGQTSTAFQARSSRLGLKFDGPDLPFWFFGEMKSSGKVEIDFRNNTGNAENKGSVLLREVYWQLENDTYKILFGQTKDVISPLNTGMLNYYNVWGAGNLGYRSPQLQFTRYYYLTCRTRMEVTTALSQLCGPDFAANDSPGSYPTIQGRVGWTIARDCNRYPIQFGISGHVGEQRYDFGAESDRISTWSANVDLSVPLTERCGIRGEVFHGQGLAGVFGGVNQSIDYRGGLGTRNSIHSTGGWGEFWWDWTDQLHYCVGYGIDNPNDDDMEVTNIRENSVIYTNIVYDFTKFLRTGVEYSYWSTDYRDDMPGGNKGRAHVVEWMWQLEF